MPFCPRCKTEFVAGTTVCSDCQVELTPTLSTQELDDDHPDYQYEIVTDALGEIETRLLCAELEQAGIPYLLSGDEVGTVHVYPAKDSRISVPRRYLEQAKELLANEMAPVSDEEIEAEILAGGDVEIFFCDSCGAEVPADAKKCPECGEPFEA